MGLLSKDPTVLPVSGAEDGEGRVLFQTPYRLTYFLLPLEYYESRTCVNEAPRGRSELMD